MSELLILLARAFDTKGYPDNKDPNHWFKINGTPIHHDGYGNIDGGAGGKFNGAKRTTKKAAPIESKKPTSNAPAQTLANVASAFEPKENLQSQEQNANISTNQGGALNEVANAFETNVTQNEIMRKKADELLQKLQGTNQAVYDFTKQCINENKNFVFMGVQKAYSVTSNIPEWSKEANLIKGFLKNVKTRNKQLIDREMQHLAIRLVENGYMDDDVTPLLENEGFIASIDNQNYYKNISDDEYSSLYIGYFGTADSFKINRALREGKVHELNKEMQDVIKDIDSIFTKVPRLPQKTILHRYDSLYVIQNLCQQMGIADIPVAKGKSIEMVGSLDKVNNETISKINVEKIDKLLSGSTFSLPAYTSTSCDQGVNIFTDRPVVFHFLADKGQKCIASPGMTNTGEGGESEVLLPHDSKITVDGVYLKDGKIEFYARIVKEE